MLEHPLLTDVVASGVGLLGLYLAWIDRREFALAVCSYGWKQTRGKVCDINDASFEIDGHTQFQPEVSRVKFLETEYVYAFRVGGSLYQGRRRAFGGNIDQSGRDYHVGDRVTVYYSAANPENCILRRGIGFGTLFPYLLVVAAALVLGLDV